MAEARGAYQRAPIYGLVLGVVVAAGLRCAHFQQGGASEQNGSDVVSHSERQFGVSSGKPPVARCKTPNSKWRHNVCACERERERERKGRRAFRKNGRICDGCLLPRIGRGVRNGKRDRDQGRKLG